jgi:SAM-dependent methyltransferase
MTQDKDTPQLGPEMARPASKQGFDAGYWEQRLQQNWGLHGVGHISYGVPYNQWLYKIRRCVFNREVQKLHVDWKQFDILDVGSGTGFWIDAWKALQVHSVTGSDLTQVAVDRLQSAHPGCHFTKLDISEPLEMCHLTTYNVVSAFDVLFHITDDERFGRAIHNIAQLLAPSGFFIFSDNFIHGSNIRAEHQVSRSLTEISHVVTDAGFQIIRRVPMFILMNAPVDASSSSLPALWRLMMLPVRAIPALGFFYGAALYPAERCLTRVLSESPTTEMMICQKR